MSESSSIGYQIRNLLIAKGIETPMLPNLDMTATQTQDVIRQEFQTIMVRMGLDLNDDSLLETPKRVAKMYCEEIFWGLDYDNFPKITVIENKMRYDEMLVTKCAVLSMCEHHFVPFIGTAHIAYIPSTKILGLSKFNRVTDFFARRPQVQERLTAQVHTALEYILDTDDIAVVIKAIHYCVHLRGVKDSTSSTVTSKLSGKFRDQPEVRAEFLALTRNGG